MSAVVHIITALERGGAQRIALEVAARLHRTGRPQHLITGELAALGAEARARLGRRLHIVKTLRNPPSLDDAFALLDLSRTLERIRAREGGALVVHTHSSKAGILGRLAARSFPDARVVHTVHGFGLDALGPRARPWLLAAERVAAAATDVLLFVSERDRAEADALRLNRWATRKVLRAGIDEAHFAALIGDASARVKGRARYGVLEGEPLALTVANLKPQKDPLFHLEVLAEWRRRRPGARLLFLGDGPLRNEVEKAARALRLHDALLLPGFVEDPRDAYAAADVFLLASRWEGLPCSALEALAGGLPLAVRDAGWAADLAFTSRVIRRPPSASATDVAAALDEAWGRGRSAVSLPRSFTLPGTLDALDALYGELMPGGVLDGRPAASERLRVLGA